MTKKFLVQQRVMCELRVRTVVEANTEEEARDKGEGPTDEIITKMCGNHFIERDGYIGAIDISEDDANDMKVGAIMVLTYKRTKNHKKNLH